MNALPDRYRDAVRFAFGDSPALADDLLALVLSGAKTATCMPLRAVDPDTPMPEIGRRDVVLDEAGRPAAVIETTSVEILRFRDVPEDFALAEGEGDYAAWRDGHIAYFTRNGGFDPEMALVCERFRLIEALPREGA